MTAPASGPGPRATTLQPGNTDTSGPGPRTTALPSGNTDTSDPGPRTTALPSGNVDVSVAGLRATMLRRGGAVASVAGMRATMLRRSLRESPGPAVAALAGLLACAWLLKYAAGRAANPDTLAILAGTWVLGWIVLPLLLGGVRGRVRPIHLRLEPIPPLTKAAALLAASAVGIGPALSLIALAALPVHAARDGLGAGLTATAGALLLWLTGLTGAAVALEAVGRTDRPIGAVLTGILTGTVMGVLGSLWAVAPWAGLLLVAGPPPGVAAALRFVPSSWPLRGPLPVCLLLVVLAALLTAYARLAAAAGDARPARPARAARSSERFQGVILRELSTWRRHPLRLQYLAFAVVYGALLAALPLLAGVRLLLPWAGPLAVLWAAAMSAGLVGLDGTALWIPLVTPGGERAEIRGRALAWLAVVAPVGVVLTVPGLLLAGAGTASIAAVAVLPALLGAGASTPVWVSLLRARPVDDPRHPTAADNPTDIVGVLLSMAVSIAAAAPAFILAVWGPRPLAPVGGLAGGYVAWWLFDRIGRDHLRVRGREVLAALGQRTAAPAVRIPVTWDPEWIRANRATVWSIGLLTAGWIPVVPQGMMVLIFHISGGWIVASHLTGTARLATAWSMVGAGGLMLLTGLILWGRRPCDLIRRFSHGRGRVAFRTGADTPAIVRNVDSLWSWDVTLYAGAAPYYVAGRRPYPQALADLLRDELGLDGKGRLLDVGCGPGPLTTLLAPLFASATGVDADPEMIATARAAHPEIRWVQARAEELTPDLGRFDLVTFAQSFHWVNQPVVARAVRDLLAPGGHCVQVHAATHRGDDDVTVALPWPQPPWPAIEALIDRHLGPVRRAGQGAAADRVIDGEQEAMRAAGYLGPHHLEVPRGEVVVRPLDEVVAAVLSLSYAAPHLFGDDLPAFVADLRELLRAASPAALFAEQARSIDVHVWRLL